MKKLDPEKAADRVYQTTVRVPPKLRHKLEVSAAEAGRSFSSEMQVRLERSVADDERGPGLRDPFIVLMAAAVDAAEAKTGRSWRKDPQTADACRRLIGALLAMLPEGEGLGRAYQRLDVNPLLEAVFAPLLAAQELQRLVGGPRETEPAKEVPTRRARRSKELAP